LCRVEADAGHTGAYYSLRSGWILGQGRPKIQTVRNGALENEGVIYGPPGITRKKFVT